MKSTANVSLADQLPFSVGGYEFESVLGSGAFSTVFKVQHQSSKMYFAAKVMSLDLKTKMDIIGTEVDSLLHLYHPNIVKIYETFKADNYFFIIIELCNGKTLRQIIEKRGAIPFDQLISFYRQILSGISYCHEKKIAHRDIKPANIFVESDGRCIIGDFGLSCIEKDKATEFCGSLVYKAPEILLKKAYNPLMADIWSLGVTFYTMAVGSIPWKPSDQLPIERCIISADCFVPPFVNREVALLIKSMLVPSPSRRKTAAELLENPLFENKSAMKLYPLISSTLPKVPLCVRSTSVTRGSIIVPKTAKRSTSKTNFLSRKTTPSQIPPRIPMIAINE